MTSKEYNKAVVEFSNRVCRFADKLIMNSESAKDITQDAFLRLWEHKSQIGFEKAKSWLFTTAYRLSIDYIHKQKKFGQATEKDEPLIYPENPDLKDIVSFCMSLISGEQRSILLMRDYEGYSYKEIGEILNLNEAQVKVYLFRARKKIKEHIKDLKFVL